MKKLFFCLLSIYLTAQKVINHPNFIERSDNNISIDKIVIGNKTTDIYFTYICPYRYEKAQYNFDPNTYIQTKDGKIKLLRADGVEIAPKQSKCDKAGDIKKFKLIFDKISNSEQVINLFQNENYTPDKFSFMGIHLINNHQLSFKKAEPDEYFKYIPHPLKTEHIMTGNIRWFHREVLENWLNNFIQKGNTDEYEISLEEVGNKLFYIFSFKKSIIKLIDISIYKNSPLEYGSDRITLVFNNKEDSSRFFESFIKYNGYSSCKEKENKKTCIKLYDLLPNGSFSLSSTAINDISKNSIFILYTKNGDENGISRHFE